MTSIGIFKRGFVAASITGTATASIDEADIVSGGKTIIITLTGATWVAAGATFDAQRQNIINGIDSAQSEATGWDAVVKANEVVSSVVRTSDTVVTITLSAHATYDITAAETITVTIPAPATSASELIGTPSITIDGSDPWFYQTSALATDGIGNGFMGTTSYGANIEGSIDLASGESLDFTGPWNYEDAIYKQKTGGIGDDRIWTIKNLGGGNASYFISEDGNNGATRLEITTLFGISTTADQTFVKN